MHSAQKPFVLTATARGNVTDVFATECLSDSWEKPFLLEQKILIFGVEKEETPYHYRKKWTMSWW